MRIENFRVDDHLGRQATVECVEQVLHRRHAHAPERLGGKRGAMGTQNHVVEPEQGIAGRRRLVTQDVEPGGAHATIGQRPGERRLVDQRAAGGVDEQDARLHGGEFLDAELGMPVGVRRHVQAHDVGVGQRRVQIGDIVVALGLDQFTLDIGIGDHDAHLEGGAASRHPSTDAPEADDEHGPPGEFDLPLGDGIAPAAAADLGVTDAGPPRRREHQGEGLLGDRGRVGLADDGERYAARGERGDVDVVVADAEARDDAQPRGPANDLGAERRHAEDDAVGIGEARVDLIGARAAQGGVVDVGTTIEQRQGVGVKRERDNDLHDNSPTDIGHAAP